MNQFESKHAQFYLIYSYSTCLIGQEYFNFNTMCEFHIMLMIVLWALFDNKSFRKWFDTEYDTWSHLMIKLWCNLPKQNYVDKLGNVNNTLRLSQKADILETTLWNQFSLCMKLSLLNFFRNPFPMVQMTMRWWLATINEIRWFKFCETGCHLNGSIHISTRSH